MILLLVIILVLMILLISLAWRFCSEQRSLPCPVWMRWLLDPPFPGGPAPRTRRTISLLDLQPGMEILDAGCGPGRLTVPAAEQVGPAGHVTAMDMQEGMLDLVRSRAAKKGLENISLLRGGIGEGRIPENRFDRVILVTVLGEIPDRDQVADEIFRALKPGGILLIEETIRDPHFQTRATVRELAGRHGFVELGLYPTIFSYTILLRRPA